MTSRRSALPVTSFNWVGVVALVLLGLISAPANAQSPSRNSELAARDLVLDGPAVVPDGPPPTVPRGYALVIGISTYKNIPAAQQLTYPESDAERMHRVLISQGGGAFAAENVHVLLGAKATLANIRQELEGWLPSVARPSDRVVVFFAGHGFIKGGRGYLAPWDVDPAKLETTAYPMSQLGDVMATKVKAGWKVLFADACHSGKITPETTNEKLHQQFDGLPTSFLTLTATTDRESSFEDPNLSTGAGLFSYFLEQALKGQADNNPCDGRITADEVVAYVRTNVVAHARRNGATQTPTPRGDYDPDMLLAVNVSCLAKGDRTPLLGNAVIEVNMDDVEVYIDDEFVGKVDRAKPLNVPRLVSGIHTFKAVHAGYEPDIKKALIAPGRDVTVTLRLRYVRKNKPSAIQLNEQGERLLFTRRNSANPLNIVPVTRSQTEQDIARAVTLFERSLADDPTYAKAAYNLGLARQLAGDEEGSLKALATAVQLEPGSVDARVQYAAVMLELGDADEAIRQLLEALRFDPRDDDAHAMMARAYHDKGAWQSVVAAADKALASNPSNAMAHLWRADALRMIAAGMTPGAPRTELYTQARSGYDLFLRLTNFSSSIGERLAFHFIGSGLGNRKHADREESYRSLRNSGYLGMCLTEQKVGYLLRARAYCLRATKYTPDDPITFFLLGNINRDLYNEYYQCEYLVAAADSYARMLRINADVAEAKNARNYLEQITGISRQKPC